MNKRLSRILRKIKSIPLLITGKGVLSYSQVGEDRILYYLLYHLGIETPSYLDIGANYPIMFNNTYFFYERGSRGVCVEPDPTLFNQLKKVRPKDQIINVGIGINEIEEADFYIFSNSGWNTFSKEEAEYRHNNGQPYIKKIKMPLKNINDILKTYFERTPDILSIDVEGLDFDIIQSLDFQTFSPKVIILETIRFGQSNKEEKQTNIIDFVISKGYSIYADTYVNTIFLKK